MNVTLTWLIVLQAISIRKFSKLVNHLALTLTEPLHMINPLFKIP